MRLVPRRRGAPVWQRGRLAEQTDEALDRVVGDAVDIVDISVSSRPTVDRLPERPVEPVSVMRAPTVAQRR
jgi:hypothetical protein